MLEFGGGGLLLAFVVEDLEADVVVKNALEVLAAEVIVDMNPPEEGFGAGAGFDDRLLLGLVRVGDGEPRGIDGEAGLGGEGGGE